MALADDVITLPRLRDAVGGVGDSEDTLLMGFRATAIVWVERWVNRKIIDVSGWESDEESFGFQDAPENFIEFKVSDIKGDSIQIKSASVTAPPQGRRDATPITIELDEARVNLKRDGIVIYSTPDQPSWRTQIRYDHPMPTIVCDRGMVASDIPAPWGDAVALMVRALYDGSSYDDIARNSALHFLMSPWSIRQEARSVR